MPPIIGTGLLRKLRKDIREKWRGMLEKGIFLLHDNTLVHTATIPKAVAKECGFSQLLYHYIHPTVLI